MRFVYATREVEHKAMIQPRVAQNATVRFLGH